MNILARCICIASLLPTAAWAAPAPPPPACVAKLSPLARMIYDATLPDLHPTDDLREVVRSHTRALVIAGKLEKADAKPAAHEAGVCLYDAQHPG